MKWIKSSGYFLVLLLLLSCPANVSFSQDSHMKHSSADTLIISENNPETISPAGSDDEFNIMILFFGIAIVCAMLGFVTVGFVAGTLLILLFLALFATGILSISIISAWYKKSILRGIKTLFILVGISCGALLGLFTFGLVSYLFSLQLDQRTIALAGTLSGGTAGLITSILLFRILKIGLRRIQKKFSLQQSH